MKIKIKETRCQVVEVDVTFPVYRYYDSSEEGRYETFTKVFERGGTLVEFKLTHTAHASCETWEGAYSGCTSMSTDSADYALGRGEFACTPELFEQARQDMLAWIAKHLT